MLPVWGVDAGLRMPTYFTCLMIGFSLASFVLRREALRRGIPPRDVLDLGLWIVPAALVGARVAHVLWVEPAAAWQDPLRALVWGGGFVFYGGALGGLAAVAARAAYTGRSPWVYGDCLAPATAMGLVWGRLGCLGGGCCHGRPADWPLGVAVPWSVTYTGGPLPPELLGVPVHPTPMYEAALALLLFVAASRVAARRRYDGQVMVLFLVGYGLLRIGVEAFRADAVRGLYAGGWLSTSQIVSIVGVTSGVWLHRRLGRAALP